MDLRDCFNRPSYRAALIAGLACLAGAPSARADVSECPGIEQTYDASRDLVTVQVNNFLLSAASNGCEALARRLLDAGASLLARDREANAALARAARAG